ncbi:unnamed protein product [marine sediment metagenome]|uniref:Nucleotidyl transferase domain-containing protein n=1 Tax=marine sediment metagenome TaxID=412755 RepID=X0S9L4_9ZZZZ
MGEHMKVVILCGGYGMRIRDVSELKPKPMIEVGGMPILWHIMKTYARYGFKEFVLCLGHHGHVIKEFFYNYEMLSNDFTIELGTKEMEVHPRHDEHGWKVTLVDTGRDAMTGARIKRVEKYLDGDRFMLTYGDAVTDMNIANLLEYHKKHGKVGTVTGVCPPSRYGELIIEDSQVASFREKPAADNNYINGGYFVMEKEFLNYLSDEDSCVLERKPLEQLAGKNNLNVYQHTGFWQCMDTYRDYAYLNELWNKNEALWKQW